MLFRSNDTATTEIYTVYNTLSLHDALPIAAILPVKRRQLEFFEAQSRDRLAASARTQNVTRGQVRGTAWPIGAAAEPGKETAFFYSELFEAADVAALDARIDTLPGLSGLDLVKRAAA